MFELIAEPSLQPCILQDNGNSHQVLTYADMHRQVNMVCSELCRKIKCSLNSSNIIAVVTEPSDISIILLVAIMKLNWTFLPLSNAGAGQDIEYLRVLTCCLVPAVVVQKRFLQAFLLQCKIGRILVKNIRVLKTLGSEFVLLILTHTSDEVPAYIGEGNFSYIVQSSGTTGKPKNIFVPSSCVLPNILDLRSIWTIGNKDCIFLSSSLTFDAAIVQIFLALSSGATLLIASEDVKRQPLAVASIFMKHGVTILQVTPSFLHILGLKILREQVFGRSSSVRVLALGGEVFPDTTLLRHWLENASKSLRLFNIYGTSEVSSWASLEEVDMSLLLSTTGSLAISLGKALSDTVMEVRSANGCVTLNGEGHLWIGRSNTKCIVERNGVVDDLIMKPTGDWVRVVNNQVFYLYRIDEAIKRHGVFVSTKVAEDFLMQSPEVSRVCCVMLPAVDDSQTAKYVAFVLAEKIDDGDPGHELEQAWLMQMQACLPAWHVPDRIVILPSFPVNAHGKVDKGLLISRREVLEVQGYGSPGSLQEILIKEWCDSLSISWLQVTGLRQKFLLCGGDSFRAVRFTNRVQGHLWQRFGRRALCPDLLQVVLDGDLRDVIACIEQALLLTSARSTGPAGLAGRAAIDSTCSVVECSVGDPSLLAGALSSQSFSYVEQGTPDHVHFMAFARQCKTSSCGCPVISDRLVSGWRVDYESKFHEYRVKVEISWKSNLYRCVDASPLVVQTFSSDGLPAESIIYVGSHCHVFAAISMVDGSKLWEVVVGDRIESSAAITNGGDMVVVGSYDGVLYFVKTRSGAVFAKYSTRDAIKSSPACLSDGKVVFGSHDGFVYCVDSQSSRLVWSRNLVSPCFSSCFVNSQEDVVYCGTLRGEFACLDLKAGDLKWSLNLEKPIFGSPIESDSGLIYFGSAGGVFYCVTKSGEIKWQYDSEAPIFSSPCLLSVCVLQACVEVASAGTVLSGVIAAAGSALDDKDRCQSDDLSNDCFEGCKGLDRTPLEAVVFGNHKGLLHCMSENGICLWTFEADSPIYSSPCVLNMSALRDARAVSGSGTKENCILFEPVRPFSQAAIVFASTSGHVYLLDSVRGYCLAKYILPGEVFSSPVVVGYKIVVGCRDNHVYCLDVSVVP